MSARPAALAGALWTLASVWLAWPAVRDRLPAAAAAVSAPGPPGTTGDAGRHWARAARGAAAAALLWTAAAGAGGAAVRWLGVRPGGAVPSAALVGFAGHASAAVGLGLCGLLYPAVAVAWAAGGAAAWIARRRRHRPPAGAFTGPLWLASLVAILAGFPSLFALTPETWVDSLTYHLSAPADFNKLHKWFDTRRDEYRWPLLAEAVFGQGFLLGGEPAAVLANLCGLACLIGEVGAAAAALGPASSAMVATGILLASNLVGFHAGNANQGFFSMAFAFSAVWAWGFTGAGRPGPRWPASPRGRWREDSGLPGARGRSWPGWGRGPWRPPPRSSSTAGSSRETRCTRCCSGAWDGRRRTRGSSPCTAARDTISTSWIPWTPCD